MLLTEDWARTADIRPLAPGSRSPHLSYLDRIDPIHELAFNDVVTARWSEVSVLEKRLGVSPSGSLRHETRAIPAPVAMNSSRVHHPLAIRAMSALSQFHQLSTHQLTALGGGRPESMERALRYLYAAGLVLRCTHAKWNHAPADDRFRSGIGDVWQIHPEPERLAQWLSGLTDLEYALFSGGRDPLKGTNGSSGSASILHNLALAEIIIRAVEVCPGVVGGWGEPNTSASLFAEPLPGMRSGIADGALVARDGSIVLIETSGASNVDRAGVAERLMEKALGWGAVCARTDLPLKVLFVNISPKAKMPRFHWHIMRGLERLGEQIARTAAREKGRASIFVADALDWFPFPLAISEGFRELEAYSTETRRFHRLVPADTPLEPRSEVVANTLAALHLPPWIAN